jgi:hypothetical protein
LSQQPDYQAEKATLIAELNQAGIKHNPDKIVRIVKQADGKILFLEEGNSEAGLQQILEHLEEFSHLGIEPDEIPDAVIAAVTQGKMLGYQGKKKTRAIYEVNFNGKTQYIAVTVSNNGYIVGANPRTAP